MAATYADFTVRFPEFATEAEPRIQMFLDDAALLMGSSESRWLVYYDVSQLYLAAHYLVAGLATESGDSGVLAPIKKQEVDDVVIHQAISDVSASADDLNSTSYGKRYVNYRKVCFLGAPRGI